MNPRCKSGTRSTTAVIIGGGHCGLAMSRCLAELSIDHVILEKREVASSWRYDRWDSLKLLTPNWQCQLPGYGYKGDSPDSFMTMQEVVRFIEGYATFIDAPVYENTEVIGLKASDDRYRIRTNQGDWTADCVVLASGAFSEPKLPELTKALPSGIQVIHAGNYRNPDQLDPGKVLVVGSSATGLQLADEVCRSGRPVVMAVGEHVRMIRNYRGRDIQWWMHQLGILDEDYLSVDDIVRARRVPSPQLVGAPGTIDLNSLRATGVELVGRWAGFNRGQFQFSGGLSNHCKLADLKLNRLLEGIDDWIVDFGGEEFSEPTPRPETSTPSRPSRLFIDSKEIKTVLLATGFRPDYSWLQLPVLDRKGHLIHDGGVVALPGIYAMGLTFMRRRKSSFIHGAEDDARDLSAHMAGYLAGAKKAAVAI